MKTFTAQVTTQRTLKITAENADDAEKQIRDGDGEVITSSTSVRLSPERERPAASARTAGATATSQFLPTSQILP